MALHSRIRRINEELRSVIASILMTELRDPRLAVGLVTVTNADISKDLRKALIWVSVMGTDEQAKDAMAALEHSRGYIRKQLAEKMTLKYVPDLSFKHDTSGLYADKINRLLKSIDPPVQKD